MSGSVGAAWAQLRDELSKYMADPNNHNPNAPKSNPPAPGSDEDPGKPVLPA
ncbi:hypothetical protein [Actinorhabdospora filicis]|nr:hypothetical protein [Actinorhabdospora filicis]